MSVDVITPQLRQKVLDQLREVTSTRKLPKSPEEIENLMLEKSRGVKKTYLNLLSKVINSSSTSSGTPANVHVPPNDPNIQMQSVGSNFQLSGQQPQQLMNTQIISLPRSGPTTIQSHPQILQVMSQNMSNNINNIQINHNRPRYTISSHPIQPQYQSYSQKGIIQQDGTILGASSTHCIPVSTIPNRVFLPSGVAVTQSGQIIQCTTGSGQQPVLIFQQPQSQNTSQITSLSSADQSLSRQSIINSQTMGSSTSIKPSCQQDGIYERLSGRRIRVATSSPNAVLIRTSSSGCLTVINPSGTTNELSHINSGQHSLHGANDNSSLSISSTTVSKPVLTVIPNPTGTQTKIIRPSLAHSPKVGLIPNSQLQTRSNVPVTQQYQPRPTIQSNPTPVISKVQSFAQGEVLQISDKDNKVPETSTTSNTTTTTTTTSTTSNKKGGEVKSSEVQAQIVSGLTDIANRYLSTVKHAIQLASKRPEAAGCVRKYIKLKDILEHPEANLNVLSFAQLPLIEKLLHEIERNPMHLVEEHLQRQAKANAAISSHGTSSSSSSSTNTSKISTIGHMQSQKQDSQQQQSQQSQQISRHHLNQQSSQSHSVPASNQQKHSTVISQQSLNHFQVPTTNLNTLLSQPFDAPSPTGVVDIQQQGIQPRPPTHFSPAGINPTISSTQSSDISTKTSTAVSGSVVEHGRLTHPNRVTTSASLLGSSTQSNTEPTGFYASLQLLATEFERMSDRMSQDQAYSRRISRAIHEISLETKSFRESIGFCLPQDTDQFVGHNNKCTLTTVDDYSNKTNLLITTSNLTGNNDNNDTVLNSLKRKHSCDDDDSNNISQPNTTGLNSFVKSNEQIDEPIINNTVSLSPSSSSVNEYEPKAKRVCVSSVSGNEKNGKSNSHIQHPASINTTTSSNSNSDELQTPTLLTDKDGAGIFLPTLSSPLSSSVIKTEHQGLNGSSEKLFLQTNIVYNPESDPLEQFPTDQLNRLNPKILIEITRLQALNIQVEGNSHPPCIDDMESYATCLDAGEWNTSCHLKLTYLDKARYLPCELPEFYIRLTPDYLQTGQLNWYYLPKLKFLSSLNNPNKDNVNHLENSERYLNLYYDELNKQFDRMKQLTDHRKSLVKIGKTWTSVICASMARFYKFDHNLLIITTIKSTQQNGQLVY
ncbi:hypothetical protein MS3_00001407 [Schistosoma haematobium]|uniref:Uncharacterized protein n=1 Tax=Schistosoma haematobium TaxID=6185 RepID=A0A6A5DBK3_SCHHA|nr:hypothetical protein MS3_00001407 [Schistosoma haematobium]KAH9595314.1 hypothetical protein MS3_00001407 [Schistosoma haematobium]CAH8462392.1 unnamed protein product [Schistosoma haematobium]CAH8463833.1 unnamed protein product [Schistosoma haematobium]